MSSFFSRSVLALFVSFFSSLWMGFEVVAQTKDDKKSSAKKSTDQESSGKEKKIDSKSPTTTQGKVAEVFPDPFVLLTAADKARGSAAVASGISWSVVVKSEQENGNSEISYDLKVKGNDAVAEATAPARNKGETMLFNDRNIWFIKSGLKKPIAISGRQKLSGQASNGDIASTHYARDYSGNVTGSETVAGEDCWKLELKAKDKKVTYDQIRYWISKKRQLGLKAEFLTLSGEVFKFATFDYQNSLQSEGEKIPFVSKMEIADSLNPKNKTTLTYTVPRATKLSDSLFNVNNLAR